MIISYRLHHARPGRPRRLRMQRCIALVREEKLRRRGTRPGSGLAQRDKEDTQYNQRAESSGARNGVPPFWSHNLAAARRAPRAEPAARASRQWKQYSVIGLAQFSRDMLPT